MDMEQSNAGPSVQQTADCMASAEQGLEQVGTLLAQAVECYNHAARRLNGEGVKVRACEMHRVDQQMAEAVGHAYAALSLVKESHCDLIDIARDLGVPLPTPETGGR